MWSPAAAAIMTAIMRAMTTPGTIMPAMTTPGTIMPAMTTGPTITGATATPPPLRFRVCMGTTTAR